MKFYLTVEPAEKIKKIFVNLSVFYILDVDSIIRDFKLDLSKPSSIYYINDYIKKQIAAQSKSKRLEGIIYINQHLSASIIDSIYEYIHDNDSIEGMVLMDDGFEPKLKQYHHLFEEVLFFPTVRRVKILECKPFTLNDSSKQ